LTRIHLESKFTASSSIYSFNPSETMECRLNVLEVLRNDDSRQQRYLKTTSKSRTTMGNRGVISRVFLEMGGCKMLLIRNSLVRSRQSQISPRKQLFVN